jgi:hypothetical protein
MRIMTPEQIIEHYGSERAAADALGMTPQIVNYWKQKGEVPIKTQAFIQLYTNGKLKADSVKERVA